MDKNLAFEDALFIAITRGKYEYRGVMRESLPVDFWALPHRNYAEHAEDPAFWLALQHALNWPELICPRCKVAINATEFLNQHDEKERAYCSNCDGPVQQPWLYHRLKYAEVQCTEGQREADEYLIKALAESYTLSGLWYAK